MKKEFGKFYVTTNAAGYTWIVLCTKAPDSQSCFEGVVISNDGIQKVGYFSNSWISGLFHPVDSATFTAKWTPATPSVSVTYNY